MVDIVLVHGTTQSASGFAGLVQALLDRGHRALTVDVPSAAAGTSAEYADLLAAQLPNDVSDPAVVAHSASGLLLPALARRVRARRQVWLAAAVADYTGRRSFLAELQEDPAAVLQPDWIGVDPTRDPVLATYFLFHDADLQTLRSALPTVSACDLTRIYAETPAFDPTHIPSTYLLPTGDRALRPEWMRRIALERLHVDAIPVAGGHNCCTAAP